MNYLLILSIALNLMRARLRQTIIAAAGVTFGIAMFVTLLSFMNGLNQMLDNLMLNRTPHIRFYNEVKANPKQPASLNAAGDSVKLFLGSVKPKDRGKEIYNVSAVMKALKSDPRIKDVEAKLLTQVFFNAGSIELAGVINGVEVMQEERMFKLSDYITEGNIMDLANVSNSIMLGKGLADKLLAVPGDVIQVTTSKGDVASVKVVGIIQIGIADVDNTMTYTSLATAQKISGKTSGSITDIQVKLKDIQQAPEIGRTYSKIFDLDAVDFQKANAQFETGTRVRTIISFAVGITLLIVAGFGIYNILNMMIYEKMDSIAILKATGFSGSDVRNIFITLSLVIGFAGGFLGLSFGWLFSFIIDHIPFRTEALPTIKTFPVDYNPVYYIIAITFALITTWIAGYFPARKAGRIDPVEIIRGK